MTRAEGSTNAVSSGRGDGEGSDGAVFVCARGEDDGFAVEVHEGTGPRLIRFRARFEELDSGLAACHGFDWVRRDGGFEGAVGGLLVAYEVERRGF